MTRPIRLRNSLVGWLRRLLLGQALLGHNGVSVRDYPADYWWIAPFPAAKGQPHVEDNLATVNLRVFEEDDRLEAAYREACTRWEGSTRHVRWRFSTLAGFAEIATKLVPNGDIVELGTGRGFCAAGLAAFLELGTSSPKSGQRLLLFDSFKPDLQGQALVRSNGVSESPWYYADGPEGISNYFCEMPRVSVIEGELPGALTRLQSEEVALVHVDLNDEEVELRCLDKLVAVLRTGSILVFDDSGNPGNEVTGRAHRQCLRAQNQTGVQLPSGQLVSIWKA